jgi:cell division protein FtsW (lipid II flippase)
LRRVSVAITITMPILFHYLISGYDYRITVCFAGFHLTYYVLFYGLVWMQQLLVNRVKIYFKERESTSRDIKDQFELD